LSLGGIVGKGTSGSASINGEVVAIGESIEGAKLVAVGNQGAYLEFKGKRIFVKVGGSTR
jgi:hypothetical protein